MNPLPTSSNPFLNALPAPSNQGTYAPLNASTSGQLVIFVKILEWFELCYTNSTSDPWWAKRFWSGVHAVHTSTALPATLIELLMAHGYVGSASNSLPRPETLLKALKDLVKAGNATSGGPGNPGVAGGSPGGSTAPQTGDLSRWDCRLPPDFKRAASEIYRSIRAAGGHSVREWLLQQFKGSRDSPQFLSLWMLATAIDFALSEAVASGGESKVWQVLSIDDSLEIKFRQLASFVYNNRTGDTAGALQMLAVKPPGSSADIAPEWLVSEVSLYSKYEHQRAERVRTANKHVPDGGKGGGGRGNQGLRPRGGNPKQRPKGGGKGDTQG